MLITFSHCYCRSCKVLPVLSLSVVTLSIGKPLKHSVKLLGKLKYSTACLQEQQLDYDLVVTFHFEIV